MKKTKKRQYERIDALNLLSYSCLDEIGEEKNQGMGRTLNVSQGGILLETHISMDSQQIISINIGLEDEMIDIKGKVIYCRQGKSGKFESGIEFQEINEHSLRILNKYIIAFRELKKTGGTEKDKDVS